MIKHYFDVLKSDDPDISDGIIIVGKEFWDTKHSLDDGVLRNGFKQDLNEVGKDLKIQVIEQSEACIEVTPRNKFSKFVEVLRQREDFEENKALANWYR